MVPRHIAIIMDGNGRWALSRGLPRINGHREGIKRIEGLLRYAPSRGIEYLTLYAFSTENWRRPREEVSFLFSAFENYLNTKKGELKKNHIRLRVIGQRKGLPNSLVKAIETAEEFLAKEKGLSLQICFNYGAREEIINAVKAIVRDGTKEEDITEELFSSYLYTAGIPDPDLIIRTSGEMRLSNFLLWQASYSEFYFTDVLWPDFSEEEFERALVKFSNRKRRYGGV